MKPSLRFDVFHRDSFVCQYCGRTPPEVVLEIDHIIPKSKGGKDEIANLVTSCFECNRGKRNRLLTQIEKRKTIKANLKLMKQKEEQLSSYYKFLSDKEKRIRKAVRKINAYWGKQYAGKRVLNEKGKRSIRLFLKSFSPFEIIDAINLSCKIEESNDRFRYMCGILWNRKRDRDHPGISEVINYWKALSADKERGIGYYKKPILIKALEEHSITVIKDAMLEALSERRSSYFVAFCGILEKKGESNG